MACLQRTDVRKTYKIKGNRCSDCCAGCWCRCCVLMQNAREIEERQVFLDMNGYQPERGMQMAPLTQYQPQR